MKTSSCKAKGRRLQQLVRNRLRERFADPKEPRHVPLVPEDFQCTLMGESGSDIKLSPAAARQMPFDIECKNTETASPWAWMKQAKANTKPGRKPLVVFTRNREGDVYAMIRFEDLLELL